MRSFRILAASSFIVAALSTQPALQAQSTTGSGLSPATRRALEQSLERGIKYLKDNQKPNGSWEMHEGITGLAARAILAQPGNKGRNDAQADKGLKFLTTLAKPDGSIFSKDMPNANTAIAIMAFNASGKKADYQSYIKNGQDFLVKLQFDEEEGYKRSDKNYGGIGYDDESRADLSNLHMVLEALKDTSLPSQSPLWDKAMQFVQRTQNRKGSNDQSWSSDDGGFIYMPGMSFAGGTQSYGSMTYAGLLSYTYGNVKASDSRVQDALKWIKQHYTVEENPGLGDTTLYYYYMVFAKALNAMGSPVLTDANGVSHNWREDLGKKLISLQHPENYWVNKNPEHWQDNKVLVTAFTTIAIEYTLLDSPAVK